MEHRTLRPEERDAWLALMDAAFGERELFDRYLDYDAGVDFATTLVSFDGPRLAAGMQLFTRHVRLRGERVRIAGLGSVATHPDYERQGLGTHNLRRAIDAMERQGAALSLLYSTREGFYGRLGWHKLSYRVLVWHPRADANPEGDAFVRRLGARDLPSVRRLYDETARELATVRDEACWRGQLVCAGTPGEDFRVAERDGRVVAYARAIERFGMKQVIEYAGASDALPVLFRALAPGDARPLVVPDGGEPGLRDALARSARQLDEVDFPDAMWRVVDRAATQRLAGTDHAGEREDEDDAALLTRLLCRPGAVFWWSDRF